MVKLSANYDLVTLHSRLIYMASRASRLVRRSWTWLPGRSSRLLSILCTKVYDARDGSW
jgi:hypothetical protein